MAGVVKNASVLSRRAVAEWSYVLARRCSTFAAPTPITYTDVQPPPEALRSVDSYRAYKATVHLRNRNDPEMEKKARKNECRYCVIMSSQLMWCTYTPVW